MFFEGGAPDPLAARPRFHAHRCPCRDLDAACPLLRPAHHYRGVQMTLDLEDYIDDFWFRQEDLEEQGACLDEDPSLTAEERSPSLMERR